MTLLLVRGRKEQAGAPKRSLAFLLPLFAGVRGRGVLGKPDPRTRIRPVRWAQKPPPGTPSTAPGPCTLLRGWIDIRPRAWLEVSSGVAAGSSLVICPFVDTHQLNVCITVHKDARSDVPCRSGWR